VPRVDNVNFALGVGTVVPTRVRIVEVPPALIEINPAWRGHQYFVVRDEIVIVDRSRKIVAVVPVGSGGAQLRGGGGGGATALNLSSDQIRQVQTVLKERGFAVVVDGRMGSRTVQAITAFQRQQGFQTTGRIDNQTVTALGLSNMSGAQGSTGAQGGATTGQGSGASTGQGGAAQQQGPAQQNQGASQPQQNQGASQQNQGANQPSTSGQANQPSTSGQSGSSQAPQQNKDMNQQPSAQQDQGANKPSTSGQADSPAQNQRQGGSK
jgi:peptidoglycan hydrolase-like protein with peptidoglycan-binding domain